MKVAILNEQKKKETQVYIKLENRPYGVMVVAVDENGKKLENVVSIRHDGRLQRPAMKDIFSRPVENVIEIS